MAHLRKGTTVEQTKYIVFNVTEKKNVALATLQTQHESTSRRLEDEIEVRNICIEWVLSVGRL